MELSKLKKYIFLIDGLGAWLSALFLGLVLPIFRIGMTNEILFVLAITAIAFGIYSLACFITKKQSPAWLRLIMVANLFYVIATAFIVVGSYRQLSVLGRIYFMGEIIIILALIALEARILYTKPVGGSHARRTQ